MAFSKKTYTEGQTPITADNLNAIQDELIRVGGSGTSPVVDYVVEQGKIGAWTYRKWSSGVAECWGSRLIVSHPAARIWARMRIQPVLGCRAVCSRVLTWQMQTRDWDQATQSPRTSTLIRQVFLSICYPTRAGQVTFPPISLCVGVGNSPMCKRIIRQPRDDGSNKYKRRKIKCLRKFF